MHVSVQQYRCNGAVDIFLLFRLLRVRRQTSDHGLALKTLFGKTVRVESFFERDENFYNNIGNLN